MAKKLVQISPFNPARTLSKAFKLDVKRVLKDTGWKRERTRYVLHNDGSNPALAALDKGSYTAFSKNACIVPPEAARALLELRLHHNLLAHPPRHAVEVLDQRHHIRGELLPIDV